MNGKNRQVPSKPGNAWPYIATGVVAFIALYAVAEFGTYGQTGNFMSGWPQDVVIRFYLGLLYHKTQWSGWHTATGAALVVLLFLGLVVWTLIRPKKTGSTDTRQAAKSLGKGTSMSLEQVTKRSDAGRLTHGEQKGILLVKTLLKGEDRYADWRQTGVVVMGPGAGKSTGFSIPMALDAPGIVLCTSNKRDLPDALRGSRNGPMYIFDPQQIVSKDKPKFRLDFNLYVTDEVRAHKLAKVWMEASTPLGAKKDSYFDTAGPNLLAGHLLACSVAGLPISQVFLWLNDPKDKQSVKILKDAGYLLPAKALEGVYYAPEEQRGGVFGTAAEMVSFLNNSRVRGWLEADSILDKRPVFSPEDFVRSGNGTMIALSKEGHGSTGPLTAALTTWILDAAEELAEASPHGRLKIPMVVLLDEVANVCRKNDWPELLSHYGSRGISTWPILQNFDQGKRVWTEDGMRQLWGAANIRIVGAGQADAKFLKELSDLLGQHLVTEYSSNTSSGKTGGGYSRTVSQKERPVMDVDDLAALAPGECVVHSSGDRAFLARTIPWYEREGMSEAVKNSIRTYEPA
jgi:type IV secretory pathway TraG/TraD family ATPase VirD4